MKFSAAKSVFATAWLASALLATSAQAQRLPSNVLPSHYTLSLTPDLKAATFAGEETIDLELAAPSNTITLNAAEISFDAVAISCAGKTIPATVAVDEKNEQATFTFAEAIPAGKATLSVRYRGILNNQLRGFYLSKTEKRNYAVTQFESTDARRAYPSFDEPALKATYDLALTIDATDTAIANTEIIADNPATPGKHTLRFATTPKMSTYLVAFLVGDFECSKGSADGVAIRVCATPDKVAYTHYGVGLTEEILHYYNNYFGLPYPIHKLDLIALPDFEAGAMENLGAITYRETDLLVDEKTASVDSRKEVALVIAHEMAHQWFGDMVTMKWWDNLWLNEGFATWMEMKSIKSLHPEWQIDQMIASNIDHTLNVDALPTTRSIRAKADTPAEINQMFDGIAYGKAGSVLQSIENYLGEETFRQGVHNYLAAHLFANATAEDFWGAQTAASGKPVDKIMESLVVQSGEPVLKFGEPAGGKLPVSQQRFFLRSSITPNPAQKWTLPVCFKVATSQQCEVLTPESKELTIPAGSFFANAGGNGYYRALYPESLYKQILANVATLSPTERISLIGNQVAAVQSNQIPVGSLLDLLTALRNDDQAEVIGASSSAISTVYRRIAETPAQHKALQAWIKHTYGPAYRRLSAPAEGDSPNLRELRATLFAILGDTAKDPEIIAQANQITDKYLTKPESVDATLAEAATSISASQGDAALFDRLQKIYESSTEPEIQELALHLLPEFEKPELLNRALAYATTAKVRNQDAVGVFGTALHASETHHEAWKFITNNWDKVIAQTTVMSGGNLVASTGSFCSAYDRNQVESFFAAHPVRSSDRALKNALESINTCIELRAAQGPKLDQWIALRK